MCHRAFRRMALINEHFLFTVWVVAVPDLQHCLDHVRAGEESARPAPDAGRIHGDEPTGHLPLGNQLNFI